jgi:hypothetical protein
MEQGKPGMSQQPDFELPDPSMRLTREELDLLLPQVQGANEETFRETRNDFIKYAGEVAVKPRAQRQPAKKRTQSRPK